MKRTASVVAIALLVVGAAVALPMAAAAGSAAGDSAQANSDSKFMQTSDTNVSANDSVTPGERLSAVVSAQEAEIDGDVEVRAFGIRIAQNASNASRSAVVADQLEVVRERLQNLDRERKQLQDARENGSMSGGEYAARASEMATRAENAREMLNRTENATARLPTERLEANGVNASAIQTLKSEASDLSGSDVAQVARQIAGSDMGAQMRPDEAGDRGPGSDRGPADNATVATVSDDPTTSPEDTTTTADDSTTTDEQPPSNGDMTPEDGDASGDR